MSNPSTPQGQDCGLPPDSPLNPLTPEAYQTGYQKALSDFAITDLLHQLQVYFDCHVNAAWIAIKPQEAETIAALLIQSLATTLNSGLLTNYLNAIRHFKLHASSILSCLELPAPSTDFPSNFPNVETPRFLYGDRLCWFSTEEGNDWGIVIGRFYNFAPHRCRWVWCYLIWLDSDSPSSAWINADIAWEDDLQPLK